MRKTTEIQVLKGNPLLRSHVIKVTPVTNPTFYIPVVDVRDGDEQRDLAIGMIKENNRNKGSKYMKPTITGLLGESYNSPAYYEEKTSTGNE